MSAIRVERRRHISVLPTWLCHCTRSVHANTCCACCMLRYRSCICAFVRHQLCFSVPFKDISCMLAVASKWMESVFSQLLDSTDTHSGDVLHTVNAFNGHLRLARCKHMLASISLTPRSGCNNTPNLLAFRQYCML